MENGKWHHSDSFKSNTGSNCSPKDLSCERRRGKGPQSTAEEENGRNPSGDIHPVGGPGEGRPKLPGDKEADQGGGWVEASPVEGAGCVEEEGSHENSKGGCHHQAGGSEAGGKWDAEQPPEHEASAVEGVGEGGHGGGEGQWPAEGPQSVAKSQNRWKISFLYVYLAVISTLFATLCPCGCHRLEDPLHRPRACVVEEEHEADQRQDRSAQLAP